MYKVLSWKITGLFQNYRYFSIFTDAVHTGTIVIIPVRYLSLRTLPTVINGCLLLYLYKLTVCSHLNLQSQKMIMIVIKSIVIYIPSLLSAAETRSEVALSNVFLYFAVTKYCSTDRGLQDIPLCEPLQTANIIQKKNSGCDLL